MVRVDMDNQDKKPLYQAPVQDKDDIVIQAGVVQKVESGQQISKEAEVQQQSDQQKIEDRASEQSSTISAQAPRSKKADYHETTKEDFDNLKPMSVMQKTIIALAIGALIVAVVYYLVFIK